MLTSPVNTKVNDHSSQITLTTKFKLSEVPSGMGTGRRPFRDGNGAASLPGWERGRLQGVEPKGSTQENSLKHLSPI